MQSSKEQQWEIKKKKIFLSDQCKETEENNRMQKTRDLIKKITDTKGTFLSKMGTIKDNQLSHKVGGRQCSMDNSIQNFY